MGFLKQVATAFKPSNIARGLDAARNPPSPEEIEASLATLTPEQRAAYDANMAQVEQGRAESQAAWAEAKAISDAAVVLEGPAGRHLYGRTMSDEDSPAAVEARIAQGGVWAEVQRQRGENKGELTNAVKQSFNRDAVPQEDDPARRIQIAAAERAARDAARAPYRAPHAVPVAISRLATRGETQLSEVLSHLESSGLAARPDHVFGVYRVPDRISAPLTSHSEKGRVVEWDIVHMPFPAGTVPPPNLTPLVATSFVAGERWVARRRGEPAVLDEELALAHCLWAGIGPERCAGLARVSEVRTRRGAGDEDSSGPLLTIVKGVVALHPQETSGSYQRMVDATPFALDLSGSGVHIEVLSWAEIGQVVQPNIHHPAACPSPFPYLPSTPQELLRAHLEVVGLHPSDCYSAQATFQATRALQQGGLFTTNLGPKQPCADGKDRMRTAGCEVVVVVYRDRPEYAVGRERWAAYQRDVLQAHLERGSAARRVVDAVDDSGLPSPIRAVFKVAEAIDWLDEIGVEDIPPFRYCWPPVDVT